MKHFEWLRELARVEEMCEGSNVNCLNCIRNKHGKDAYDSKVNIYNYWHLYTNFAICIVEGKPMYKDDIIYNADGYELKISSSNATFNWDSSFWESCTLQPPAPKSVLDGEEWETLMSNVWCKYKITQFIRAHFEEKK